MRTILISLGLALTLGGSAAMAEARLSTLLRSQSIALAGVPRA